MAANEEIQNDIKDIIDRLGRIETKLDNDGKAIYGNGKPGLLDRMVALESKLQVIQAQAEANHDWFSRIRESIGWLLTTAIAIYAAFFR